MDKSLEILQKLNWFLKPVSDFILFLFTTKTGVILLLAFLALYFFAVVNNRLKDRKLLYLAAEDKSKLPFTDFFVIITDEITRLFAKIISNITVLIVVLFVMLAIVGLSTTFTTVDNYISNQNKIKELTVVLKNLNQKYKVAKVEIINYNIMQDSTTLKVKFFDYAKNNYVEGEQILTLPGHDIYFLNYVMNFEYAQIENGSQINIAIPYLVFSDKLQQTDGIKLNVKDDSGVPYVFHRDTSDLYGVTFETYNDKMKEIISYMNDPELARKAGVRSSYSAAPHFVKALRKGQTFIIWIEQTGGLVIKQDD